MWTRPEMVWGLFAVPERDLCVLGDVRHLAVAELACGTAYFSAWLARAGADVVAVDLSGEQLGTARRLQAQLGPIFPLLQGDAEQVPLASGHFGLVVSEHGVGAWCDPERWLPEASRLLGPRGRLVFLTNSHLSALCVPADRGVAEERLLRGQREAYRVHWPGRGRVPSLTRGLGAAAARVGFRGRSSARDIRAARIRRPPLLRDRLGCVAGRGALGGNTGVSGDPPASPGELDLQIACRSFERASPYSSLVDECPRKCSSASRWGSAVGRPRCGGMTGGSSTYGASGHLTAHTPSDPESPRRFRPGIAAVIAIERVEGIRRGLAWASPLPAKSLAN